MAVIITNKWNAEFKSGDTLIRQRHVSGGYNYAVVKVENDGYEVIAEFGTLKRAVRYAVMREELPQDIKDQIHLKADQLISETKP